MGRQYTCPMHPKVLKETPGSCPICGMDLEAMAGQSKENPELTWMTIRFWISVALTLPVVWLAMIAPMVSMEVPAHVSHWIQAIAATGVVFFGGWPFFTRAWQSILNRHLNMFILIALGVSCAYGYSMVALLWPGLFTQLSYQESLYFEAASVITALVLMGQVLEGRAREKAGDAIEKLLHLAPKTARRVIKEGEEKDVPLEEVQKGDHLRVRPGEQVPTDGVIIEGWGLIDESMITGESISISKEKGDKVVGATLNHDGTFIMEALSVGEGTVLAKIIQQVSEAQRSRAPIQRIADKVASYFVPVVILCAFITSMVWVFVGPSPKALHSIMSAVSVLIIACPCALGLATPMSIINGVGRGALHGILIKDAEALEVMGKVNLIVVDKTGTLTEGRPHVSAITPLSDLSEDQMLQLAAALEQGSEHPLGKAIVTRAQEKKLTLPKAENFQMLQGKGMKGAVEKQQIAIGNQALMTQLGIPIKEQQEVEALRSQGMTVFYLAKEQNLIGLFGIADRIRDSSQEAVDILHKQGVHIVMLTGDHKITAQKVGQTLGIDEIYAEVLPEEKQNKIKELQQAGWIVAMAGDGINDAPALSQANVGIAIGTGTDVAIESAGVTLLQGDLRAIASARLLSLKTVRNIHQNLWFAFAYNGLAIPIAAGVLYPVYGILLNPMIAGFAMAMSSLSIVANALRLKAVKI